MALRTGGAGAHYPLNTFIAIGLIVLNLAGFFVMLGGAAALQHDRNEITALLNAVNTQLPGYILSYGEVKPLSTPGNFISYQWFKAVFQVLTLLFALGALALGRLYHTRVALVGLFAALGVFLADSSDTFYYLYLHTHKNVLVPSKVKKEVSSYFSGCMICATLNFLLVITLGLGHDTGATTAPATTTAATTGVKDTGNGAAPHV